MKSGIYNYYLFKARHHIRTLAPFFQGTASPAVVPRLYSFVTNCPLPDSELKEDPRKR